MSVLLGEDDDNGDDNVDRGCQDKSQNKVIVVVIVFVVVVVVVVVVVIVDSKHLSLSFHTIVRIH